MTRYKDVVQNKQRFLALTGYTNEEFEALLPYFMACFKAYVAEYTLEGKPRKQRRYSEYSNSPLPTMADKLLFILSALKTNNLQVVQGQLFAMHQPEACLWFHVLLPVLNQALAACGELPARTSQALAIDQASSRTFFHDGTERPIHRPQDAEAQKTYYSGKKKGIL